MSDCQPASYLDFVYGGDVHQHIDEQVYYLGKCCKNVVAGAMGAASFEVKA